MQWVQLTSSINGDPIYVNLALAGTIVDDRKGAAVCMAQGSWRIPVNETKEVVLQRARDGTPLTPSTPRTEPML